MTKNEKAASDCESLTAQLPDGLIDCPIIPPDPQPINPIITDDDPPICAVCGDSLADSVEVTDDGRCATCAESRPLLDVGALPFDPEHCSGSLGRLIFFPKLSQRETGEVRYAKAA